MRIGNPLRRGGAIRGRALSGRFFEGHRGWLTGRTTRPGGATTTSGMNGREVLRLCFLAWVGLIVVAPVARAAEPVSFKRDVGPIFVAQCQACHNAEKS